MYRGIPRKEGGAIPPYPMPEGGFVMISYPHPPYSYPHSYFVGQYLSTDKVTYKKISPFLWG